MESRVEGGGLQRVSLLFPGRLRAAGSASSEFAENLQVDHPRQLQLNQSISPRLTLPQARGYGWRRRCMQQAAGPIASLLLPCSPLPRARRKRGGGGGEAYGWNRGLWTVFQSNRLVRRPRAQGEALRRLRVNGRAEGTRESTLHWRGQGFLEPCRPLHLSGVRPGSTPPRRGRHSRLPGDAGGPGGAAVPQRGRGGTGGPEPWAPQRPLFFGGPARTHPGRRGKGPGGHLS